MEFSKIHLTLQPEPPRATTTPPTGDAPPGSVSLDVACLAAVLKQQYKDAHDMKEETLILYNATTGSGTPQECIDCHDKYRTINYIITNSEMPKFKNPLTP